MSKKKYIFNPKTLSYEVRKRSRRSRILYSLILFAGSVLLAVLYMWIYTSVWGIDLPKTKLLKKKNSSLRASVEMINRQMDRSAESLDILQLRDNGIYRTIFGMNEISPAIRNEGLGGVNRYDEYDEYSPDGLLKGVVTKLDVLTKKSFIQSQSFDEVSLLSKRAGDMASCIPAIPPVTTDRKIMRLSSAFGIRYDPFTGRRKRHTGVDFALKPGNPVYATGDGVVENVSFQMFGYGNSVIINHGFGYKTRYAHLKTISVVEGMKVTRGECIATSGNSGRSSGPHLHYEVLYKNNHVNPYNYYDLSITPEEFATMVKQVENTSERITLHPSHRKRK